MTLFLLCTVVPLLFGLWAQMKVKRTFERYSQVAARAGLTGAQVAAAVLRSSRLPNLEIRPVEGHLSERADGPDSNRRPPSLRDPFSRPNTVDLPGVR